MNIKETSEKIHQIAREKGFWDNERNVGELLMLVTSELGEALEAHRKHKFADKSAFIYTLAANGTVLDELAQKSFKENIKDTFEDEIADAVIRLLDLAYGLGIDLEFHILAKITFNKTRERLHGKAY